jgi:hypothetical protein
MDLIEEIGVSQERAETGFGAEIDRAAVILDAWKIGRICLAEFSATQGDEAWILLFLQRLFRHFNDQTIQPAQNDELDGNLSNFCDEDLKGIDGQSTWRFGCLQSFSTGKQDLQISSFDLFAA